MTDFKSDLPDVCKTVFELFIYLKLILGLESAILLTTSSIYPASVESFFKNLYLAGTL